MLVTPQHSDNYWLSGSVPTLWKVDQFQPRGELRNQTAKVEEIQTKNKNQLLPFPLTCTTPSTVQSLERWVYSAESAFWTWGSLVWELDPLSRDFLILQHFLESIIFLSFTDMKKHHHKLTLNLLPSKPITRYFFTPFSRRSWNESCWGSTCCVEARLQRKRMAM